MRTLTAAIDIDEVEDDGGADAIGEELELDDDEDEDLDYALIWPVYRVDINRQSLAIQNQRGYGLDKGNTTQYGITEPRFGN